MILEASGLEASRSCPWVRLGVRGLIHLGVVPGQLPRLDVLDFLGAS